MIPLQKKLVSLYLPPFIVPIFLVNNTGDRRWRQLVSFRNYAARFLCLMLTWVEATEQGRNVLQTVNIHRLCSLAYATNSRSLILLWLAVINDTK
jgi:hypothetical protein